MICKNMAPLLLVMLVGCGPGPRGPQGPQGEPGPSGSTNPLVKSMRSCSGHQTFGSQDADIMIQRYDFSDGSVMYQCQVRPSNNGRVEVLAPVVIAEPDYLPPDGTVVCYVEYDISQLVPHTLAGFHIRLGRDDLAAYSLYDSYGGPFDGTTTAMPCSTTP